MEVLGIDRLDFSRISLGEPQAIQGGSYYAKLHSATDGAICIQLPRCTLKQGIVSTKKGKYCDLMYEHSKSSHLVEWIEKLEVSVQDKIDRKKSLWFQGDLTRDDIESMMSPLSRSFKSGRKILIRTHIDINRHTGADKCIVYDAGETIVGLDALNCEREVVPLVQIDGIRFTSRSFEVELKLVQAMALDKLPDLSEVCLIKVGGHEEISRVDGETTNSIKRNTSHGETDSFPPSAHIESSSTIEEPIQMSTQMSMIEEVDLDMSHKGESITLKNPDEVYYDIYRSARDKAKRMRQAAVEAYLEARQIKSKYLISDIDSSDEDEELIEPEKEPAI